MNQEQIDNRLEELRQEIAECDRRIAHHNWCIKVCNHVMAGCTSCAAAAFSAVLGENYTLLYLTLGFSLYWVFITGPHAMAEIEKSRKEHGI